MIINTGQERNYLPGGFGAINPESQTLVCIQRQNYKYEKSCNHLINGIIDCLTKELAAIVSVSFALSWLFR